MKKKVRIGEMTEARKVINTLRESIINEESVMRFSYDKSKKRLDLTNSDYKEKLLANSSPRPIMKILKSLYHGMDSILIPNRRSYFTALADAYKIFKAAGYDLSGQEDYEMNQF